MPEINQDTQKSRFWGSVKSTEIEDKGFMNIGFDVTKNIDVAKLLTDQNIRFSAQNNDELETAHLTFDNSDFNKVFDTIKKAVAPNEKDNSWGNINYSDIENKKKISIGDSNSQKINLKKLMNESSIPFSARTNTALKVTTITVNQADLDRTNTLIKNAIKNSHQQEQPHIKKTQQNTEQNQSNKQPLSKITVSADLMSEVSKRLQNENIDFALSLNNTNKTVTFAVNQADVPAINDVLKDISQNNKVQEEKIPTSEKQPNIEDKEQQPTPNSVQEEKSKLNDINDDIKQPTSTVDKGIINDKKYDIDEKSLPIFSIPIKQHEGTIERLAEKNDNLTAKIEKNQARVDKLYNRIDDLKKDNSVLLAVKAAAPFGKGLVDAIIEKNNDKIKDITDNKIPNRVQKIKRHETKLENNNQKISKVMDKLKNISSINKFVSNFKNMNSEERRNGFMEGLTAITQHSFDKAQDKCNDLKVRINDISNNLNTESLKMSETFSKNNELSSLKVKFNKSQGKLDRAEKLLDNLDKISKGEVLKDDKEFAKVVSATEKAVEKGIETSTNLDDLADNIVEATSSVIAKAVEKEQEQVQEQPQAQEKPIENTVDVQSVQWNSTKDNEKTELIEPSNELVNIDEVLNEIASLCDKDVSLLQGLDSEKQEHIVDLYLSNMTDDGLENAELIQNIVNDSISLNTVEKTEPVVDEQPQNSEPVIGAEQKEPIPNDIPPMSINEFNEPQPLPIVEEQNKAVSIADKINMEDDIDFDLYEPQEKVEICSLYTIEQNGEVGMFIDTNNNVFDLIKEYAAAEQPFTAMMEYGEPISAISYATAEQSSEFEHSVSINVDKNEVSINSVQGNISDIDRTVENTSITNYHLDKVVELVSDICNGTKDNTLQEQLFNERLENCIAIDEPVQEYVEPKNQSYIVIENNDINIETNQQEAIVDTPQEPTTDNIAIDKLVEEKAESISISDNTPVAQEIDSKTLATLKEITSNYDCYFTSQDLKELPSEVQTSIANLYQKTFNENNLYEQIESVVPELNKEIMKEINLNHLVVNQPMFSDLVEQGVLISDAAVKGSIFKDYMFGETFDNDDLKDSFNSCFESMKFTNSNDETLTVKNFNELKSAIDDPNNTFFKSSNEVTVTKSDPELVREERPVNPEPIVTADKESDILTKVAATTGIPLSDLNALPKDMKNDIIGEFEFSGGNLNSDFFSQDIATMLNVEVSIKNENVQPVANIQSDTAKKEKENPLKSVEELIEGNANMIDGIINNLPPEVEKDKDKEQNQVKDTPTHEDKPKEKPKFTLELMKSAVFAPRSNKQQEKDKSTQKNNEMGL